MAELPEPELTFDLVETGCHGNYEAIRTQDRSNERIKLPLKTVITSLIKPLHVLFVHEILVLITSASSNGLDEPAHP